MTSMAFLLGVLPLLTASGAGAASRRSIGTGVFGGVIAATLLSLVFAPLAYLLVSNPVRAFKASRGLRKPMPATEPA